MNRKKRNATAIQLWEQVFSNLAKQENASIWDPDYDPTEDQAKIREGLKEAGWSDDEIRLRMEIDQARASAAPVTSPGVSPHVEAQLGILCDDVEAAMERQNVNSHARVARGVEPRLGPYAANTNVVMTDEGIVTVGSHLFRFCGLVARAFTRTLHLNPYFWEGMAYDERRARIYLRASPELLQYWMRIYLSYAVTGTNVMVPFRPAAKFEVLLFEQVARAMEIFAIAHEYGHHHLDHGRAISDGAHREEYEADQFALRICYEVERQPLILQNPYLASGAGGVVLLLALKTLRDVENLVGGAKTNISDTHPDAYARIDRFESVAVLKPDEFKVLAGYRLASKRILSVVVLELLTALKRVPREAFRAVTPAKFGSD